MSSLGGELLLDLNSGFEWHGVLYLHESTGAQPGGVLFEAGGAKGGPKVTVGLRDGGLVFVLTDLDGKELVTSPSIPATELLRPVDIGCVLNPPFQAPARLQLMVNFEERASAVGEVHLGRAEIVRSSFGTDLQGEAAATFSLFETLAYNKVLSAEERAQLRAYLTGRFTLG
ncbi:MAG TPA: hypothetical protein VHJ20_16635 [Polyangia bacterium]|nr:hypothetical protein [Polyangia bacterium]